MTILEFINGLNDIKAEMVLDSILLPAANRVISQFKRRIFNDGEAASGAKIGNYSTKPAGFSRRQFVKKSTFIGGSDGGDTMQFKGGYKEFRQLQGRQTAFVDLRLSGSLENSIQLVKDGENAILIAITNEAEAKKARENEKRFSKVIFSLSESEKKTFNEALLSGAEKVIKRALR